MKYDAIAHNPARSFFEIQGSSVLVQSEKIQEHLLAQDVAIDKLLERVQAIAAKVATTS